MYRITFSFSNMSASRSHLKILISFSSSSILVNCLRISFKWSKQDGQSCPLSIPDDGDDWTIIVCVFVVFIAEVLWRRIGPPSIEFILVWSVIFQSSTSPLNDQDKMISNLSQSSSCQLFCSNSIMKLVTIIKIKIGSLKLFAVWRQQKNIRNIKLFTSFS